MKERPILFGGEMVRALLDGRKTQTRRVVKPQPTATPADYPGPTGHWWPCKSVGSMVLVERELQNKNGGWDGFAGTVCPYGQPGDRLWVREAHGYEIRSVGVTPHEQIVYRASKPEAVRCYDCNGMEQPMKWRPSIHMPRWASRITLEIVSVRVERLQEISEADARAEGAFFTDYGRQCFHHGAPRDVGNCPAPDDHHPQRDGWSMVETDSHEQCLSSARMAFANIWEQINGHGAWAANPFVWVVEFKRIYQ